MATKTHISPQSDESRITLAIAQADYSASSIARAVEDSDTHLTGLVILPEKLRGDKLAVEITVNRRDPAAVVRSIERYGMEIIEVTAPESIDDETARQRALELLHILNI